MSAKCPLIYMTNRLAKQLTFLCKFKHEIHVRIYYQSTRRPRFHVSLCVCVCVYVSHVVCVFKLPVMVWRKPEQKSCMLHRCSTCEVEVEKEEEKLLKHTYSYVCICRCVHSTCIALTDFRWT